jgi:hypothetical protein
MIGVMGMVLICSMGFSLGRAGRGRETLWIKHVISFSQIKRDGLFFDSMSSHNGADGCLVECGGVGVWRLKRWRMAAGSDTLHISYRCPMSAGRADGQTLWADF